MESTSKEKLHTLQNVVDGKHGGWKTMPYIIGNETFEKLATLGLLANFMVYLLDKFNMEQVYATNVLNIFNGTSNLAPLLGAYLADSYFGRYRTLGFASVSAFLGMFLLTITATIPQLRPPECTHRSQCIPPSGPQLCLLFAALAMLAIGAGGIRPCNLPFGLDQFDESTEKGRKAISSLFNWYYFSFTASMMVVLTLVVYIQDSVSWSLGLGIPTLFMLCSVSFFFLGTNIYVIVEPKGGVLAGMFQVLMASLKKRHVCTENVVYFDPPSKSNLPLTNELRFLNKAAIIEKDSELDTEGKPTNPWELCSVQQVEELKCVVGVIPIWVSGVISFMPMVQQSTFSVLQALKMDRHLNSGGFEIPAGSLNVFSMLALTFWIPIYDRLIVPSMRQITKQEQGITQLQRIGMGMFLSCMSMLISGIVENKRRNIALLHPNNNGIAPMSALWLVPQFVLNGLSEAFSAIGQIEFYYKEFPEHMKSIAGSLFFCTIAGASYLSSFLVSFVHKNTGNKGDTNWIQNDINRGRIDYFYYLIAAMGICNLLYFLVASRLYHYKGNVHKTEATEGDEIELDAV